MVLRGGKGKFNLVPLKAKSLKNTKTILGLWPLKFGLFKNLVRGMMQSKMTFRSLAWEVSSDVRDGDIAAQV